MLRRVRSALESHECYGCRFTGELHRASARLPLRRLNAAPRPIPSGDTDNLTSPTSRELSGAVSFGGRMTWNEICDRYPDQWVIMVDHDWQAHNVTEFKTARVLATGATRAEAKARARSALETYRAWGCHFTGSARGSFATYRPWLLIP
ncbi:MAG TPA: hypothetical protein VN253_27210 [Kofleriaceae bacterium]|nr:hypothetical protein [Kofleriaceae bacterium]